MSSFPSQPREYPNSEYPPSDRSYGYDLKLEVHVQEGAESIPIASIFHALVEKIGSVATQRFTIYDCDDKEFKLTNPSEGDKFQQRFHVESTQGQRRKVMLGFKLDTETPLSTLKHRMFDYLRQHKLFLRPHYGGFDNGLQQAFLGYIKEVNPSAVALTHWQQILQREIAATWKKANYDEKTRIAMEVDLEKFQNNGTMKFPIIISRNNLTAQHKDKKIVTSGLYISTPAQFAKTMKTILDSMVMQQTIPSFIPAGLRREDSEMYYRLLGIHATYLHEHRNIQLGAISLDTLDTTEETSELTIINMVDANPHVHNWYHDGKARLHLSTSKDHYPILCDWIDKLTTKTNFPYSFSRITPTQGTKPSKTNYSALFHDQATLSSNSFDPSTIKTTRSPAWTKQPPTRIEYDLSLAAFPTLPPTNKKISTGHITPSTTTLTMDDPSTIAAIEKVSVQANHDLQVKQGDFDTRLKLLEDRMQQHIQQMEDKLTALVTRLAGNQAENLDPQYATKAELRRVEETMLPMSDNIMKILKKMEELDTPSSPPRAKRQDQKETPPRQLTNPARVSRPTDLSDDDMATGPVT